MDHVPDDYLPPLAFATHSEDLDSEDQRPADFPFNSTFPPEYGVTLMSPQSYVQDVHPSYLWATILPTTQPYNPFTMSGSMNAHPTGGHPTLNSVVSHHQPVSRDSNIPQQQVGRTLASPSVEPPDARQPTHTQPAQADTTSRPNIIRCLIPGCLQTFRRSDAHGTHLRNKHNIPIPRGQRATTWVSRPENLHHFTAACEAQSRAVGIVSSFTGEGEI